MLLVRVCASMCVLDICSQLSSHLYADSGIVCTAQLTGSVYLIRLKKWRVCVSLCWLAPNLLPLCYITIELIAGLETGFIYSFDFRICSFLKLMYNLYKLLVGIAVIWFLVSDNSVAWLCCFVHSSSLTLNFIIEKLGFPILQIATVKMKFVACHS